MFQLKKILLLLFIVGTLSACSIRHEVTNHNYVYTGAGNDWSAELNYNAKEVRGKDADGINTYSSEDHYEFKLIYKGSLKELASMKHLYYKFNRGSTGEGSSSMTFDQPVTQKVFTSKGGGTGAIMRDDLFSYTLNS